MISPPCGLCPIRTKILLINYTMLIDDKGHNPGRFISRGNVIASGHLPDVLIIDEQRRCVWISHNATELVATAVI